MTGYEKTDGVVTEQNEEPCQKTLVNSGIGICYQPKVTFFWNGSGFTENTIDRSRESSKIGDKISLLIYRKNPHLVRIASLYNHFENWIAPILAFIFGGGVGYLGLRLLMGPIKKSL